MATIKDEGQDVGRAKEFIWSHLEEATKEFIIYVSSLTEEERKKLYINKILCHLSAERKGEVVGKEIAILSL
ncbi:MAG TPA: hypothetical protein VMI12_14715 [Puia sp.]|nr:hypothetical protein [Puia sp.]